MKSLVFGAIMPHGLPEIPTIAGDEKEAFSTIRTAMENLSEKIMEKDLDTIIILTPHGLRVDHYINIYTCSYVEGELSYGLENFGYIKDINHQYSSKKEHLKFECDRELALSIYEKAREKNLPAISTNYGVREGRLSNIQMDWGVFVPMWFMRSLQDKVKLIVIDPSRLVDLNDLTSFGELLQTEIEKSNKKVGIIASADHGHAHLKEGPAGYHKESEEYDLLVLDYIKNNTLEKLMDLDSDLVEKARVDSLWQMQVLYGAIKDMDLKLKQCIYDVPSYFGMIVAGFF